MGQGSSVGNRQGAWDRLFVKGRRGAWDRLFVRSRHGTWVLSVGAFRNMGQRLLKGAAIHRNEETRSRGSLHFYVRVTDWSTPYT